MNIHEVFDTLTYGKGTAKRGDYYFYSSVKSTGEMFNLGYKFKELKMITYFVSYKGETVLVITQNDLGKEYEYNILYDGRMKHNFNKKINVTLDKIVSYLTEPYSTYQDKYCS